jgi:hypothetical protein
MPASCTFETWGRLPILPADIRAILSNFGAIPRLQLAEGSPGAIGDKNEKSRASTFPHQE